MTKSNTNVALTSKQLKHIGSELLNIAHSLEMQNLALEGLEFEKGIDTTVFLWNSKKYMNVAFEQNQEMAERLDNLAAILLENDNANELEALKDER